MRSIATLATGSLVAASVAHAQVLQWDIKRRHESPEARISRRAESLQATISNKQALGGYFATVDVGTPAQQLTLQLDTGSSDIWVPSSSASICSSSSSSGTSSCTLGTYDSDSSSTFDVVGKNEFSIEYVDGTGSSGDYFTDVFQIAGANLTNMTMGLGSTTTIPYGLVGIGYALNEAIVSTSQSTSSVYKNLPQLMVSEDLIKTNAYSLWLNDLDASTGNILFGGIDTDKYEGDLSRIDIIPTGDSYTEFAVYLTSVGANSSSGSDTLSSSSFPFAVVLDSGTTLSYVPQDLAEEIWNEVGAIYSAEAKGAVIPCSMATSKGTFSFGFGGDNGPKISVGMDELVLSLVTSGSGPDFESGAYDGQEACEFGIQNMTGGTYLLGDSFLRSAYVVYDLVNNQIALAKTDFNATTSHVVAFASRGAEIPSATAVASQVTASGTAGGSATTPTYGASAGFADSVSSAGSGAPAAFDWAPVGVAAVALALTSVGSGFFLL